MSQKGEVVGEMLDIGDNMQAVGCHHKKGTNACGGCYARLSNAIDAAITELNSGVSTVETKISEVTARQRCINALSLLVDTIHQRLVEKPR